MSLMPNGDYRRSEGLSVEIVQSDWRPVDRMDCRPSKGSGEPDEPLSSAVASILPDDDALAVFD